MDSTEFQSNKLTFETINFKANIFAFFQMVVKGYRLFKVKKKQATKVVEIF